MNNPIKDQSLNVIFSIIRIPLNIYQVVNSNLIHRVNQWQQSSPIRVDDLVLPLTAIPMCSQVLTNQLIISESTGRSRWITINFIFIILVTSTAWKPNVRTIVELQADVLGSNICGKVHLCLHPVLQRITLLGNIFGLLRCLGAWNHCLGLSRPHESSHSHILIWEILCCHFVATSSS